ncbi:hypothetical protein J6590_000868 [Homalodisca vitripennis]|nr:hypothetical protein J6590_000868 [Homalodisca vitripennis]
MIVSISSFETIALTILVAVKADGSIPDAAYSLQYRLAQESSYNGPAANIIVTPQGFLADTPEVAALKSAHLAEKMKLYQAAEPNRASNYNPVQHTGFYSPQTNTPNEAYSLKYRLSQQSSYNGPPANIIVTPQGFLADTPEVAAIKNAHLAEHKKLNVGAQPTFGINYNPVQHSSFQDPNAHIIVTREGFLADTPEVEALKNAHLAEHNKLKGVAQSNFGTNYNPVQYNSFQGPQANIIVTPEGFLADTPEVAATKNAHLAEHYKLATGAGVPGPNVFNQIRY